MRRRRTTGVIGIVVSFALCTALPVGSAVAAEPEPLPNGFTAKVVARSGERISGSIEASGYDLGIYVGPGVRNVEIVGAKVTGARDEGIMVQDTSAVVIRDTVVEGNAVEPHPGLEELKGIALVGTEDVLLSNNVVQYNDHGGIGVYDDGPNSPFAPHAIDARPVPGEGNVIVDNLVKDNLNDCGIVLSAKNPGGGVAHNLIIRNEVVGYDPATGNTVPGVGGIIVAGGAFGPVSVTDNVIAHNIVTGGFIPGISLHAFGPGTIEDTGLIGNVLSSNGAGAVSEQTTGIEIFAVPGVGTIAGTQVLHQRIANDHFGVFHLGDTETHLAALLTSDVTVPVFP